MKLKTRYQLAGIKRIDLSRHRIRRRTISAGRSHIVTLVGGPFDRKRIALQACTYGTLMIRVFGEVGRYNQQNEWVPA
jgi:hypothetical protein